MRKLKTFFTTFFRSISEPAYYRDVFKAKFRFSLKYFLVFYLFLALIQTVHFALVTLPQLRTSVASVIDEITTYYPTDLVLTYSGNQLDVSGVDQPFYINFPQAFPALSDSLNFNYLAVLDAQATSPAEDAFITLSQSQAYVRNPDGGFQAVPYESTDQTLTLNRSTVGLLTSTSQTYATSLLTYLPLIVFVILIIGQTLISLVMLLPYSAINYLSAKVLSRPLTFTKTYQIGLHTITFAETVQFLQTVLFPNFQASSLYPLTFFGVSLIAIYYLPKSKPALNP